MSAALAVLVVVVIIAVCAALAWWMVSESRKGDEVAAFVVWIATAGALFGAAADFIKWVMKS